MPKKISLNEIKVQSFVTALDNGAKENVKGGHDTLVLKTANDATCPTVQGDSDFVCYCGLCEL
jgi:hypothetical protein